MHLSFVAVSLKERYDICMKMKRVMIAAPKSGSGKTVITCALLQVLKDCGWKVASYKCGPDYIDPMFHEKIIDVPAKNLDTFFTDEEKTRELFLTTNNFFASSLYNKNHKYTDT